MSVNELLRSSRLSWLAASGKESDVVLSSRIRLARNFREIPFPNRADFNQLAEVRLEAEKLLPGIAADLGQDFDLLDLERITPLQRDVLIEKQLISRNFIQNPQHRVVFITADRATSIMVNEEDHLRIQCMAPGLDLDTPFARASHIDDMVESQVDIAFDEKMGYLTSCPTNLGTGLRASVLLHLPGLVFTRNIQSIMNISPQLGLLAPLVLGPVRGGGDPQVRGLALGRVLEGHGGRGGAGLGVRRRGGRRGVHRRRGGGGVGVLGGEGVDPGADELVHRLLTEAVRCHPGTQGVGPLDGRGGDLRRPERGEVTG